jgi:zinc and cadmium transporter
MTALIWISLLGASLLSAIGGLFLFFSESQYTKISPYLLSLAAGTMFGGVFIHLIFRLANKFNYGRVTGLLIVLGLGGSLLLERVVHWHCHCRDMHEEPLPYILAVGDAFHNVIDGVLIATSFIASTTTGVAALVAVVAHKIPKEFGDFGVMVEGGFSKAKAVATNIFVSLFMFLGAGAVVLASQLSAETIPILLPLVAGNFLYIAGSDLLPAFKSADTWPRHLLVFLLGVGAMYSIPYIKAALV